MLSLWALVLLSAVIFGWVKLVDRNISTTNEANRGMEALALAHSGVALALHPAIGQKSPELQRKFEHQQSCQVTVASDGGHINLNYILAGADPQKIAFFKRYLALKGLTFQQREIFTDCLLDWVSPPTCSRRPLGIAENADYAIPHRPLQSLDELALVNGSGPLVSRRGWQDDLTLFSSGPLDIESISPELLALVPGISEQRASQFVKSREDRLKRSNGKDSHPFKDIADALNCLGITREQFSNLSLFLGFRDPVIRIQSVGQSERMVRTTEVVVRKDGNNQILFWSEK